MWYIEGMGIRLDEAKYDMYEILKEATECWRELGTIILAQDQTQLFEKMPAKFKGDANPFNRADKIISRVENGK